MQHYTQIYTQRDINLVNKVICKPNFNTYQVISTNQHSTYSTTALIGGKQQSVILKIFTLAEEFALIVWKQALDNTLIKFPDYLDYKWVEENKHPIKRLVFSSKNRIEAENFFLNQIIEICNNEKMTASEGYRIEGKNITVILEEPILTNSIEHLVLVQFEGEGEHFKFTKQNVSFSYQEIKNYFSYFDSHLLELFNMDESVKQVSELDKLFLQTAEYCNLRAALHYLEEGANINAINEFGDTAIALAAQCAGDSFNELYNLGDKTSLLGDINPALVMANEKAVDFIEALLIRGADINMYGQEGSSAILYTALTGNHILMKYLLEHGADPNLPLYPYEEYSWMYSDVLQEVHDNEFCCSIFEERIYREMENLLLDAGAR